MITIEKNDIIKAYFEHSLHFIILYGLFNLVKRISVYHDKI